VARSTFLSGAYPPMAMTAGAFGRSVLSTSNSALETSHPSSRAFASMSGCLPSQALRMAATRFASAVAWARMSATAFAASSAVAWTGVRLPTAAS